MIVPLGSSYLELVTVVDKEQAAGNPFGRFVSRALRQSELLAGRAAPVGDVSTDGLTHQALTRAGVSVDLYGIDEIERRTDSPFLIDRPADQLPPGLRATKVRRISSILVARPADEPFLTSPSGDTVFAVNLSSAVQGALLAVRFDDLSGQSVELDQRSWDSTC